MKAALFLDSMLRISSTVKWIVGIENDLIIQQQSKGDFVFTAFKYNQYIQSMIEEYFWPKEKTRF